jgi:hypothetical protein
MPPTSPFSLGTCKRREDATAEEREEADRAGQRSLAAQGQAIAYCVCALVFQLVESPMVAFSMVSLG